jgi:hypothetical protein
MALWSAHDVAVGHHRRYDRAQLQQLLTDAGFDVVRLWSWNVLLRPLAAVHRKRDTGSDIQPVHPLLNLALRGAVALERLLPVSDRRGVSLFAVAVPRAV